MNEYDHMCEDPKMNEDGHRVWPGFEWANPDTVDGAKDMREELTGYQDENGIWVELIDDTPKIDALFEYLADPKHRFDIDESDYSAKNMAEMFEARCVEYDDGYYKVGREYLDDHYGKVYEDPMVDMREEEIQQVGANVAGSEHEEERYLWVEAEDGRVFAVVRPAYVEAEGLRSHE